MKSIFIYLLCLYFVKIKEMEKSTIVNIKTQINVNNFVQLITHPLIADLFQKGHVCHFTAALSSPGLRSALVFEPKVYADQLDIDSPPTSKVCVFLSEETTLTPWQYSQRS